MSGYGKKKGIKGAFQNAAQKTTNAIKKAVAATVAATVLLGAPGYYLYGTIKTEDVKVTGYTMGRWDSQEGKYVYDRKVSTNKGDFVDRNSLFHLKGDSKTEEIWQMVDRGKTYRVTYYGHNIGPFSRNLLDVREITEEELKAEAEAKKQANAEARAAAEANAEAQKTGTQQAQPPSGVNATQPAQTGAAFSGRVTMYNIITDDGKSLVQVTVPAEVPVTSVKVNSVTPLSPPPASPPAPGR